MAVKYGYFNSVSGDRPYNAETMSNYFKGLVADGVYENVGGALQVIAGTGMNVVVKTGRCLIDCKWCENDAALTLPITAASSTLNRWTAVVAQLDYANRLISITTKDGTPAASPSKPPIREDQYYNELCLAYVYVGKGVTAITQSAITDSRADTNVCGWVTGLIKQVDTSQLFLQWQTAYEEFYDSFTSWFDTLTSELQVNTYITRFEKTVTGTPEELAEIELDMEGYTWDEYDIVSVYINGLRASASEYEVNNGVVSVTVGASNSENSVTVEVLKSQIGNPHGGGGGSTFEAIQIPNVEASISSVSVTDSNISIQGGSVE